jgi:hypothetical protein
MADGGSAPSEGIGQSKTGTIFQATKTAAANTAKQWGGALGQQLGVPPKPAGGSSGAKPIPKMPPLPGTGDEGDAPFDLSALFGGEKPGMPKQKPKSQAPGIDPKIKEEQERKFAEQNAKDQAEIERLTKILHEEHHYNEIKQATGEVKDTAKLRRQDEEKKQEEEEQEKRKKQEKEEKMQLLDMGTPKKKQGVFGKVKRSLSQMLFSKRGTKEAGRGNKG